MDLRSSKGNDLANFLMRNDLKNFVNEHTRVCRSYYKEKKKYQTSKSLIDVCISNQDKIIDIKVIGCPFSDHKFLVAAIDLSRTKHTPFVNIGRSLSEKNLLLIADLIKSQDFSFEKNDENIDQIWSDHKTKLLACIDLIAPLKQFKERPIEIAPWADEELLEKARVRDYYYFKFQNSNTSLDSSEYFPKYKQYKAEFQRLEREKMKEFMLSKKITDFKANKLYWEFQSAYIKIKSCKSEDFSPNVFFHEEKEYDDPVEIGSIFNTFFTNLSSTSLSGEPESDNYIDGIFNELKREGKIWSTDVEDEKFRFVHTNANIVEKLILNLNATSGAGFSEIPSKVIKYSYSILAPILASLFNHCIDLGKFPIEWKSAIVTPLYKNKGDKSDFNNYRGISVLPPIAKIFEKILAMQISIFLNIKNILFSGQHGFRNGHSCETALHELISYLNENRNKRAISLLLFIDFRKAFDLVDSQKLIRKLFHYGFSNSALKLIKNYFSDRHQSVKYDKKMSPLLKILLGVPQGSVLGPLFFLIMINDLAFIIDLLCKLFADDTTLGDYDKDLDTLINRFVKKLKVLLEWCDFNKLDINWSKTYFMFVTNKRIKPPKEIIIDTKIVNNKTVDIKVSVVTSFKLLGVTLDNKLTFIEHCSNIKKIVNKKLYSINRLFFLCTSVKIHFFKTFILPYFDYCLSLILYFPPSAYQSLNNCFNLCLYKLFKF